MAPTDPIRVLWLTKGLGQGGMERLLVTQARFGDRQRFDYRAAYLVDRPHSVVDELDALDVPTVRLGRGSGMDPRWLTDLVQYVRRERIDVVHVHSPMPASMARPVLRVLPARPRIVYTEHNSWDCYGTPTRAANLVTFALDDSRIAVSEVARRSAPRVLRSKTQTLIHGIDIAAARSHTADRESARNELGLDQDAVVIGTVANLRAEKAYPVMLEAARSVLERHPDVVFLSVGQGPLHDDLIVEHQRLGLGYRFRFLGYRSDALRVMAAFDVFTLSSDEEGLPVALMEATALGLPVVATAVGGVPTAVENGTNGLLVPAQDPRSLADALGRVVGSPDLRAKLSAGSMKRAAMFDAASSIARIEDVYKRLDLGTRARATTAGEAQS